MEDKSRTKKEIKYFSLEHDGEEQRTSVNSKRKKFNKQREGEQIVKRRTETKSKADPLRTVEFTV
jgi:hypothetical protein